MKLQKCLDTTIVNRHELSDSPQAALAKNVMVIPVKSTQRQSVVFMNELHPINQLTPAHFTFPCLVFAGYSLHVQILCIP